MFFCTDGAPDRLEYRFILHAQLNGAEKLNGGEVMNGTKRFAQSLGLAIVFCVGCGGEAPNDELYDVDPNEDLGESTLAVTSTCNAYYTAEKWLGGVNCGSVYETRSPFPSQPQWMPVWCNWGDKCIGGNTCQVKRTCGVGTQYHAGRNGMGRWCGAKYVNMYDAGIPLVNFYCEERDKCLYSGTCQKVGKGCNVQYHAYRYGGGRVCGENYVSGYKVYHYCQPGDYCYISGGGGTCQDRNPECGIGATYHAYPTAGGPTCGPNRNPGYYYWNRCQPGDTCIATSSGLCRNN